MQRASWDVVFMRYTSPSHEVTHFLALLLVMTMKRVVRLYSQHAFWGWAQLRSQAYVIHTSWILRLAVNARCSMPAIFELMVVHRNTRCVGLVGIIQTLFSTIWAASTWVTKCNTDSNCEWSSLTDCTNAGQLRCYNCSSGMTAMKILTRIEISPVEGPQSISWHLIGSNWRNARLLRNDRPLHLLSV